jgi:hypothetical protein
MQSIKETDQVGLVITWIADMLIYKIMLNPGVPRWDTGLNIENRIVVILKLS